MSQYHHFAYDDVNLGDDGLLIITYTIEEEDDDGDIVTEVATLVVPTMNITAFIHHAPDDSLSTTVLLDNGHWMLLTTDVDNSNIHEYLRTKLIEAVQG